MEKFDFQNNGTAIILSGKTKSHFALLDCITGVSVDGNEFTIHLTGEGINDYASDHTEAIIIAAKIMDAVLERKAKS